LAGGVLVAAVLASSKPPVTEGAAGVSQSCVPRTNTGVVRLVLAPGSVAAGQEVHFRIDNSTGPAITFGTPFSVQQCIAGTWVLASFSPPGPWTKQLIRQRPSRGRWRSLEIPTTAAAGEYRIRKSVSAGEGGRWLYADFRVATES
jgi:hypothetical protein